ncbi:MAG: hypothetical protein QM775_19195 [Pirellulales bacterium]
MIPSERSDKACVVAEKQAEQDYPNCDTFKAMVVEFDAGKFVVRVVMGKDGLDLFPIPMAHYLVAGDFSSATRVR